MQVGGREGAAAGTDGSPASESGGHVYASAGLRIRSDRPLYGLPGRADGPVDLTLVAGEPTAPTEEPPEGDLVADTIGKGRRLYTASRDDDGYLLRFSNLCDVRISDDLRRAEYRLHDGADPGLVGVLLSGTTLAFVLALSGRCVLHASAVEVDGEALAFVGHSGMGKSTLTVAACAAGAKLVAEDVLAVDADEHPRTLVGNCDVRLRSGALTLLDGATWPRTTTPDGREAVQPPQTGLAEVPLRTIVIPRPNRRADTMAVERVDPATAVFRLINFPRVVGLQYLPVVQRQFEAMGRIASRVPVVVADVPWGPPFADDLGEQLIGLLRYGRNGAAPSDGTPGRSS